MFFSIELDVRYNYRSKAQPDQHVILYELPKRSARVDTIVLLKRVHRANISIRIIYEQRQRAKNLLEYTHLVYNQNEHENQRA